MGKLWLGCLLLPISAWAVQLPSPDRLIQQDQQRQEHIQRSIESEQHNRSRSSVISIPPRSESTDSGICFDIEDIHFSGHSVFSDSELQLLAKPFLNRCLGMVKINALLDAVSGHYFSRGYITSRAYLREQNLHSGRLHIEIVEGQFSGFEPSENSFSHVFPSQINAPLNLRDLEQGLEHINRLQSMQARMRLLPGEALGQSRVDIDIRSNNPWWVQVKADNSGQKTTGEEQLQGLIAWDNPLGLYDYSYLSLQTDTEFGHKDRLSRSLAWHWDIPLGYWSVALDVSRFEYQQLISGQSLMFESSGVSDSQRLAIKRLIYRDQNSKFHVSSSLQRKQTRNYLEDVLIGVSSRVLSIAELGVDWHEYFNDGGRLFSELKYSRGIDAFGSEDSHQARFERYGLHVDFTQPFSFADSSFVYRSQWQCQYSDDELYASEQVSIGSEYSVRGFKEESLSGNSGGYWRNTLYWQPAISEQWFSLRKASPFIGFDAGVVRGGDDSRSRHLSGAIVGVMVSGRRWSAEISWSEPVNRPDEFSHSDGQFYFTLSLTL
jgi:hemolysin activation/secretion protein